MDVLQAKFPTPRDEDRRCAGSLLEPFVAFLTNVLVSKLLQAAADGVDLLQMLEYGRREALKRRTSLASDMPAARF
jgi:hypothetical protein